MLYRWFHCMCTGGAAAGPAARCHRGGIHAQLLFTFMCIHIAATLCGGNRPHLDVFHAAMGLHSTLFTAKLVACSLVE